MSFRTERSCAWGVRTGDTHHALRSSPRTLTADRRHPQGRTHRRTSGLPGFSWPEHRSELTGFSGRQTAVAYLSYGRPPAVNANSGCLVGKSRRRVRRPPTKRRPGVYRRVAWLDEPESSDGLAV